MITLVVTALIGLAFVPVSHGQASCSTPVNPLFCVANAIQYAQLKRQGAKYSYNYGTLTGPNNWHCLADTCRGNRQSPINIRVLNLQRREYNRPLRINGMGTKITKATFENSGSVAVLLEFGGKTPTLSGGPLFGEYEFYSNHWHWGVTDQSGSEHFIDGRSYPIENHFIFANIKKYGSFEKCLKAGDGLAVIGILYRIDGSAPNNPLFSNVRNVRKYKQKFSSSPGITFGEYFGEDKFLYAHYKGGLTTPPCLQVVQWIVSLDIQRINRSQINLFRRLTGKNGLVQSGNWRPPQPLNSRTVWVGNFGEPNY